VRSAATPDARRQVAGAAPIAVTSVHLTSGRNPGVRRRQLQAIYGHTADCSTSLVVGDMNACVPAEDDRAVTCAGFADVWPVLNPGVSGATRHSHRLDRAALRSGEFTPSSMSIVGGKRVPGTTGTISDHLGTFVTIRRSAAGTSRSSPCNHDTG